MKSQKPLRDSSLGKYAYYTGLGFQMLATIGVFTYLGYRIDRHYQMETPLWTAVFSLLGVCISIYFVVRSVLKGKQK